MITNLFYFDLSGKTFCQIIIRSKNFKQILHHQSVEAEAVDAEAVEAEAVETKAKAL